MIILPIKTSLLKTGDNLVEILSQHADIQAGDILVVSSKAIATTDGTIIDLSKLTPTDEAKEYAQQIGKSAEFCEAVLQETKRMNGSVRGTCPCALLTEVSPNGLEGALLVPSAGLDESNIEDGSAIGWPLDPVHSAITIRSGFENSIGVIVSDSCSHVRRWGVSAFALAVAGFDPFKNEIGNKDLFDHDMRVTVEARADQYATAANTLMGNAAQSTPAAIIRDHGTPMTEFAGWVKGMKKEEDLFADLFKQ